MCDWHPLGSRAGRAGSRACLRKVSTVLSESLGTDRAVLEEEYALCWMVLEEYLDRRAVECVKPSDLVARARRVVLQSITAAYRSVEQRSARVRCSTSGIVHAHVFPYVCM